jgi:hypothetical protein
MKIIYTRYEDGCESFKLGERSVLFEESRRENKGRGAGFSVDKKNSRKNKINQEWAIRYAAGLEEGEE